MTERNLWAWRKDLRDERDHIRGRALVALPSSVDLSVVLPSVRDQGALGSCTGFGIGGNLTSCAKQHGVYTEWFSPTWIYNGARLIDGCLAYDDGAYPRDCLEFLRAHGCLLEHFRPYRDTLDKTDPTTWPCAPEALKWPLVSYARCVDGADGIKSALASGHLVSIGAPWFESWTATNAEGVLSSDYSDIIGGHEFLCYGYDDAKGLLYCQNSWGTGWGNAGRFLVPYSAIDAWKREGGYDAHIVTVNWAGITPDPTPRKKRLPWWAWCIGAVIIAGIVLVML